MSVIIITSADHRAPQFDNECQQKFLQTKNLNPSMIFTFDLEKAPFKDCFKMCIV
jgi:hypothetical protein